MKRKQFIIRDWAGNDKTSYYGTFDSVEDAWDRLFEEYPDDEEQLQEFYVDEV